MGATAIDPMDVEKLLESAQNDIIANEAARAQAPTSLDPTDLPFRYEEARGRDTDRPRSSRADAADREATAGSDHGSANGSVRSRRRSTLR